MIEAGFVSPGQFTIELHGTEGSLDLLRRRRRAGSVSGRELARSARTATDAFSQWVGHIRAGTRARPTTSPAPPSSRGWSSPPTRPAATGRTLAYRVIRVGLHSAAAASRTSTSAATARTPTEIGVVAVADRGRGDRAPARRRARRARRSRTSGGCSPRRTSTPSTSACRITCTREAIVAAAAAGKHILCEKPLCLTAAEAARVQAAVSEAGITLMCAHNQLFLPAVAEAKALARGRSRSARLYEVRTTDSFFNDFDPATMGWRANAVTSGGGELIDTGYHPTYLMLHLAGAVAGRGDGDALHPPPHVHGGRGLRAGADPVRQRRRRPALPRAGRTSPPRSPSGSRPSASWARCTATGHRSRSGAAAAGPRRSRSTRSTRSSPRSGTSPTACATAGGPCTPSARGSRCSGSSWPPTRAPAPAASRG